MGEELHRCEPPNAGVTGRLEPWECGVCGRLFHWNMWWVEVRGPSYLATPSPEEETRS